MQDVNQVLMLDPRRANDVVAAELRAAFERVLGSGQFILGAEVESFERESAAVLGVRHAIGVSSGTDALLAAMLALGVGPGDEVICPTFTFFATAGSIWRTGARPVFVDIEAKSFNLDPAQLERHLSPRTRGIIVVHLFGQAADMDPIQAFARDHDLWIIEDAAQSLGCRYRGRPVGALGTLGCFSFFPSKNLGGFGDGGLVTTDRAELAERVRALRNHGSLATYEHTMVGGNFRLDALQAALLRVKLKEVDKYGQQRRANAERYQQLLAEVTGSGSLATSSEAPQLIRPPEVFEGHVFNQYVVRVRPPPLRDALQVHLRQQSIGSAVYYPRPLHLQPCFRELGGQPQDHPVAEQAAAEVLALPIYSELTIAEMEYVAQHVRQFLRTARIGEGGLRG